MTLSHDIAYAIERFTSIDNLLTTVAKDSTFYTGSEYRIYNPSKFPGFYPIGRDFIEEKHTICAFKDGSHPNTAALVRSSKVLIRKLLLGTPCIDCNNVLYKTSQGIVADCNCMPLIMSLRDKANTSKIIVVNSYCFKKSNIASKIIIDNLIPFFLPNTYKEDLYENPFKNLKDSIGCPVKICDLSDIWLDKFPTFDIDGKTVMEAAKKYFTI